MAPNYLSFKGARQPPPELEGAIEPVGSQILWSSDKVEMGLHFSASTLTPQWQPDYCLASDSDKAHSSSPGPDNTMALHGSTGHPDRHGPGGSMTLKHQHGHKLWPRPGHPCGLWWYHGQWISRQIMGGPSTQAWSSVAAWAWMSPWTSKVAVQATQIGTAS